MDKTVIVVGAGIKGLYIARELSNLGYEVTILERSEKAGGKFETIRSPLFTDGAFAEMGAMRVLESDAKFLRLLKQLSIAITPFLEYNENAPYSINSHVGKTKDLNLGVLIDAGFVERYETENVDGLSREMTFDQIIDLAFENAEDVIHDQNNGKSMSIIEYLSIPGKGQFSRKCAKLILDLRLGKNFLSGELCPSVLEFLHYKKHASEKAFAIKDGFDSVIQSLINEHSEKSIKLVLQTEVISVDYSRPDYVEVFCKKVGLERIETFQANSVLFASPCLQKIKFTPQLPYVHQEMIHMKLLTECVPAVKSVLRFDDCFWQNKEHGGVVGGTCLYGPSLINQIRLPPFNCKEEGYVMIYLLGEPVHDWISISKEDRINEVLEALDSLFPSMKGNTRKNFKDISEVVWNEPGSGAYILFDAEKIRDTMKPVDRLVFSSVPRGWVEDTLTDGQLALEQIQNIFDHRKEMSHESECKK